MPEVKCEKCPLYLAAEKFAITSTPRRPRDDREYPTAVGKLIAATASAKGLRLCDVSRAAGFGSDYTARVCRGDLRLSVRAAMLIGRVLGIELGEYVDAAPAFTLSGPAAPAAAQLPLASSGADYVFSSGPCAAEREKTA